MEHDKGKLAPGTRIKAIGFPLVSHINDGKTWTILYSYQRYINGPYYYIFKRGTKRIAQRVLDVDLWTDSTNNNYFKVLNP